MIGRVWQCCATRRTRRYCSDSARCAALRCWRFHRLCSSVCCHRLVVVQHASTRSSAQAQSTIQLQRASLTIWILFCNEKQESSLLTVAIVLISGSWSESHLIAFRSSGSSKVKIKALFFFHWTFWKVLTV